MYCEDYFDKKEKCLEQYTVLTPLDVMDILGIGKNSTYNLGSTEKAKSHNKNAGI